MWIADKKKALDAEKAGSDVTSLEEKIKKLQKHQAFQAELTANQPRIAEIKDKGERQMRTTWRKKQASHLEINEHSSRPCFKVLSF